MSEDRISVPLYSPQQGYQQLLQVWQWAKAKLQAGQLLVLELRLETRSDAQNRLLHSRMRFDEDGLVEIAPPPRLIQQATQRGQRLIGQVW